MVQKLSQAQKEELLRRSRARKVFVMIVILGLAIVGGAGGFLAYNAWSNWTEKQQVEQRKKDAQENKPSYATSSGGVYIGKNGVEPEDQRTKGLPIMMVFSDFICPACGNFERTYAEKYIDMATQGKITLELHPISVLDKSSSDKYSTRATSFFWSILNDAPQKAIDVFKALFAEDFQPEEASGYDAEKASNEKLVALAVKNGVSKTIAENAVKGTYEEWTGATSQFALTTSDFDKNGKVVNATPTIIINNEILVDSAGEQSFQQTDIDNRLKALGVAV